jgi:hypothetical protein
MTGGKKWLNHFEVCSLLSALSAIARSGPHLGSAFSTLLRPGERPQPEHSLRCHV